jgi:hypothetical protein
MLRCRPMATMTTKPDARAATAWKPKTPEDWMLWKYARRVGGFIYVEVPIGGRRLPGPWEKKGAVSRRLDAVRLANQGEDGVFKFDKTRMAKGFWDSPEVIEVKHALNRSVIGQVLAGRLMFEACYNIHPVQSIVVCSIADPALRWVCEKSGIMVGVVSSLQEDFENARLTVEGSTKHRRKGHIKKLAGMLRDAGHAEAANHIEAARINSTRHRPRDAVESIATARRLFDEAWFRPTVNPFLSTSRTPRPTAPA